MSSKSERKPSKAQISRHAARELVVQGLYQWQINPRPISAVEAEFRSQAADDDMPDHENWVMVMGKADLAMFHSLLHGIAAEATTLDKTFEPLLDRKLEELDVIEHAILRLGTFELMRRPEVPYRAVINEAVELTKSFGAEDSHKYINSILDKLAAKLRSVEVANRR